MEAAAFLNRHLLLKRLPSSLTLLHQPSLRSLRQSPPIRRQLLVTPNALQPFTRIHSFTPSPFPNPKSNTNPLCLLLSLSFPNPKDLIFCNEQALKTERKDYEGGVFTWNRAVEGVGFQYVGGKKAKAATTVVLLGWLGAENKHLRRYGELYNAKGIHAVSFVVPVMEVLRFDLGRRVERRICQLADELECWVNGDGEEGEKGGGGEEEDVRCLVFHTFSNTGWLV